MTNERPDDASQATGSARVLVASLAGAAVQAASRAWMAWLWLDLLAWAFALQVPILLVALEYGITYTLLVAIHELGHVWGALAQGHRLTKVVFRPFRGATVWSQGNHTAETDAWSSLAGPIGGTVAALVALALYAITGHAALLLTALTHLCDELFYLLPDEQLDSQPKSSSHDGQTVRFRLGDGGGLSSPQRRRLQIGYRITLAADATGIALCLVLGWPLWAWFVEQLYLLVWVWANGY